MYENPPTQGMPGQPQHWPPRAPRGPQQPMREIVFVVVGGLVGLVLTVIYLLQHRVRYAIDVVSGDYASYSFGWHSAFGALAYLALGGALVWTIVRILANDILGRWAAIALAGAFGSASLLHRDPETPVGVTILVVVLSIAVVAVAASVQGAWTGHRPALFGAEPAMVGLSRLLMWAGATTSVIHGVGLFPLGTVQGRFFFQAFLLVALGVAVLVLSVGFKPGSGVLSIISLSLLGVAGIVSILEPTTQWGFFPLLFALGLIYPLMIAPVTRSYLGFIPGTAGPSPAVAYPPPPPGYAPAPTVYLPPPSGHVPPMPPAGYSPVASTPSAQPLPPPPLDASPLPPSPSSFAPPIDAVPLSSPQAVTPPPVVDVEHDDDAFAVDDSTVARPSVQDVAAMDVLRLRLDGRTDITIDGPVVLGRMPVTNAENPTARCEVVPDPTKSLSRSHVLVSPGEQPGEIHVLDLGSTNGTWVVDGDATSHRVSMSETVIAREGNSLLLGGDIELKVVR